MESINIRNLEELAIRNADEANFEEHKRTLDLFADKKYSKEDIMFYFVTYGEQKMKMRDEMEEDRNRLKVEVDEMKEILDELLVFIKSRTLDPTSADLQRALAD